MSNIDYESIEFVVFNFLFDFRLMIFRMLRYRNVLNNRQKLFIRFQNVSKEKLCKCKSEVNHASLYRSMYNDNGGGQGGRVTMGLKREIHIAQPGRF